MRERIVWMVCVVVLLGLASVAAADPSGDEIAKLETERIKSSAKQDHANAYALAKKIYALQVKASGATSKEAQRRKATLADAAYYAHDYVAAEKLFLELVAAADKQPLTDSRTLTEPLGMLIMIYEARARFDEIDPLWNRILATSKKLDGEKSLTYSRHVLGHGRMLNARGEYAAAQRELEQALALFDAVAKSRNDLELLAVLQDLGFLYMKTNQVSKATTAFDRMIQISNSHTELPPLGKVTLYWSLGNQYFFNGHKDLAAKLFDKGIEAAKGYIAPLEKASASDPQLVDLYSELGLLHAYRDDLPKAEQAFTKALALAKKRGTPGPAQGALAELVRRQGKTKEAFELLAASRAAFPPSKLPNYYDVMLAEMQRELGDSKRAQQLIEGYLGAVVDYYGKRSQTYVTGALKAVEIYATGGDLKKATQRLTEALDLAEKDLSTMLRTGSDSDHAIYMAKNTRVLDGALSFNTMFAPKSGDAARLGATTLLRRKGRLIDASAAALATIRGKLSPADKALLDELTAARATLAKLGVAGSADPVQHAKHIAELEETVQKLEAQLSKKSAAYRKATQPIELAAIQKLIPKDARLIELVNYEPLDPRRPFAKTAVQPHLPRRYLAYVIAPTGDPQLVELGDALAIEQAIVGFRKALADPDNDEVTTLGKALYGLTMAKLASKLGGATNVLIAPDGALNVIPFAALVDDSGEFLIKKYTFTYLTSGRDLLRLEIKTKAEGGGVMFADPAFDAKPPAGKAGSRGLRSIDLASLKWPRLPGTAAEADAVAKTLKGITIYRGDTATEGNLKKVKGPRFLHLATHGFFLPDELPDTSVASYRATTPLPAENPMLRSGLAFAGANALSSGDDDGLLTALEASGLDLQGTKLVVLSACETGIGKTTNGDGVYGLRRSLVIAGAESLVMSLWQVDDFATKDLMAGLYKRLADGDPRSAALRATQLELLAKPKYKHPFFWAAFLPEGASTPMKD